MRTARVLMSPVSAAGAPGPDEPLATVDERYGPGMVKICPALRPV